MLGSRIESTSVDQRISSEASSCLEELNRFSIRPFHNDDDLPTRVKFIDDPDDDPMTLTRKSSSRRLSESLWSFAKRAGERMRLSTEIDRLSLPSRSTLQTGPSARRSLMQVSGNPFWIICANCQEPIVTDTVKHIGRFNFVVSVGICCMGGCLGCCFFPFFMESLMDVTHTCPECGCLAGEFKQLDH